MYVMDDPRLLSELIRQLSTMKPMPSHQQANPYGQVRPGNIDLYAQPEVRNRDGSRSTVDSISIGTDDGEVLIPRVTPDGRHLSSEEAIREYEKTGRHLGVFVTPEAATHYAKRLHEDYASGKYRQRPLKSHR